MNFYYQDILRETWGFSNPNHAAALIATVSPLCWLLTRRFKLGFYAALFLFAASGILIIDTFSRGGMAAFLIGNIAALTTVGLIKNQRRLVSIVLVATSLFGYAKLQTATARYTDSWAGDASVLNRLTLWREVPGMLADAPNGWGHRNGHLAYMNWYQPLENHERFRNLVSLHLTTLVESSGLWRAVYTITWITAFLIVLPHPNSNIPSAYFGSLFAFFISGVFTDFEGIKAICIIPIAIVTISIAHRIYRKSSISKLYAYCGLTITATLISCLYFVDFFRSSPQQVFGTPNFVQYRAKGEPDAWILFDAATMGALPGKALRNYFQKEDHPNMPILRAARSLNDIPKKQTLIVGSLESPLTIEKIAAIEPDKLILLNPLCLPEEVSQQLAATKLYPVIGLHAKIKSGGFWTKSNNLTIVEESGVYIQNWPSIATKIIFNNTNGH